MSYCVNCGVELDTSAGVCPLCSTPVLNPNEIKKIMGARPPFPGEKGQVETVKRKDLGVLLSVMLLAIAITCWILNTFVFTSSLWSLAVIGVCGILWVISIPAVIYTEQSIYVSLLFDGAAVAIYLYMLTFLTDSSGWFMGLGLPVTVLVTGIAELMTLCIRRLPKSFLSVALYLFTAVGLLCMGLELLINHYLGREVALHWSAVVLTVCAILDIAVITMLSHKRLRNAVRKRLHF